MALRISDYQALISDIELLKRRIENVKSTYFDLQQGQHCIRDLFICLNENCINWPDISGALNMITSYSSICCNCNFEFNSVREQLYVEVPVPPDNTSLNHSIEEYFNTSDLVGRVCEDGCKKFTQAEIRNQIASVSQTKFILILLTRSIEVEHGYELNRNRIISTNDVFIR